MTFGRHHFGPLPAPRDPRDALAKALPSLAPPRRVSVVDAAENHMRVKINEQWSQFRRDTVPYMIEPMEMATSRDYRALVFAGPSRSSKTMMLNSVWAHSITCDPCRVGIYFDERTTRDSFEMDTFSPIVRNSPDLADRKARGRGSDTQDSKLFRGGSHITLDIATASRMQERTLRLALCTEFDRYGSSIDGEGAPMVLLLARTFMAGSRGMVIVESSPRAPITDETTVSADPHVAPTVEYGVFSLFPNSTQGRLYWPCPSCGGWFVPRYDFLDFPQSADPVEAGAMAKMRCPKCKDTFGHDLKAELNANAQWLHMSRDGKPVSIDSGEVRETEMLGYWLDGTQAAFMPWSDIVAKTLEAEAAFATTGDEDQLRAVINTRHGAAYKPRAGAGADVSIEDLETKAKLTSGTRGVAPSWTRFILIAVDTQGTYFSVGVYAFGADGRRQPIDRFDLNTPPSVQEGAAQKVLKPGMYADHWKVLDFLETKRWAVEGGEWELGAVAAVVDMQGEMATSANAYKFKRRRTRAGKGRFWYLSRGRRTRERRARVWLARPESSSARSKRRAAKDIEILNMETDLLKDAATAGLLMTEDGPNYCHVPDWMTKEELLEFTAERRDEKGNWDKRPGFVRNESLDHAVQAQALFIILGGERLRSDEMPDWARLDLGNLAARYVGEAEQPKVAEEPEAAPWIQTRENWL